MANLSQLVGRFRGDALASRFVDATKKEIANRLGFDPEKPETLSQQGIDPSRGAALGVIDKGELVAAIGVTDGEKAVNFLKAMLNRITSGAATIKESKVDGATLYLITREGRDKVQAAFAVHKGFLVASLRSQGNADQTLQRAISLKSSLADNSSYKQIRGQLGNYELLVYVDGKGAQTVAKRSQQQSLEKITDQQLKQIVQESIKTSDVLLNAFAGVGIALRLQANKVGVQGYFLTPSGKGQLGRELFKGKGKPIPFAKYVAPDALLVGRVALNAARLMDGLMEVIPASAKESVTRGLEQFKQRTDLDLKRDILSVLGDRYAFAFYMPDVAAISQPLAPAYLRFAPGVFMIQIADTKRAEDLLTRLERRLVMAQVPLRTTTKGPTRVYSVETDGQPMIQWALVKDLVVVGSGNRIDGSIGLIEKGGENVVSKIGNPRAKQLLESGDGAVVYYSLNRSREAMKAMSFPLRLQLVIGAALKFLGSFDDVVLGFEVRSDGYAAEVAVRLNP
jgi:hypothetical protein